MDVLCLHTFPVVKSELGLARVCVCVCVCKHEDIFLHSQSLPVTSGLQRYLSLEYINSSPGDTCDLCTDGGGSEIGLKRICDHGNEGVCGFLGISNRSKIHGRECGIVIFKCLSSSQKYLAISSIHEFVQRCLASSGA